jgi:signal peptide peptidase SppA
MSPHSLVTMLDMSEYSTRYARLIQLATTSPWAILPEKLTAIAELLDTRLAGEFRSEQEIEAAVAQRRAPQVQPGGAVGVLEIYGAIVPRATLFTEFSGGTSAQSIAKNVTALASHPDVSSIVLAIDSPGGNVQGLEEAAAAVYEAAQRKPIIAVADGTAASAAYWLGSQATEFVASPSAMVGSIGIVAIHQDPSGKLAKDGIGVQLITAGKHKAAGMLGPLEGDDLEHEQAILDGYYGVFLRDVARGRGTTVEDVEAHYGQGRMFRTPDAQRLGLIDGIETLDQVLARLTSRSSARPGARAETNTGLIAALQERLQMDALKTAVASAWKD